MGWTHVETDWVDTLDGEKITVSYFGAGQWRLELDDGRVIRLNDSQRLALCELLGVEW